jgi:hypothetical protein
MGLVRELARELRGSGRFDAINPPIQPCRGAAPVLEKEERLTMARVRNIESDELASDLAAIYREFAGPCGPVRNQAPCSRTYPPRCGT